jgi:hypothetical protein
MFTRNSHAVDEMSVGGTWQVRSFLVILASVVGLSVMEPAYSLPGINTIKYLNV